MISCKMIVDKYSKSYIVLEESSGYYDYDNGGKWTAAKTERVINAAIFHLSARDINSQIQYNEGGSFTRSDIKIYTYDKLIIGSEIECKSGRYTISTDVDYEDVADGLMIYIARKGGKANADK